MSKNKKKKKRKLKDVVIVLSIAQHSSECGNNDMSDIRNIL